MKAMRLVCILMACLLLQACGAAGSGNDENGWKTVESKNASVERQNGSDYILYLIDDTREAGIDAEYKIQYTSRIEKKFLMSEIVLHDKWMDCTYRIKIYNQHRDGIHAEGEVQRPQKIAANHFPEKVSFNVQCWEQDRYEDYVYLQFVRYGEKTGISPISQTVDKKEASIYFEDEYTYCVYEIKIPFDTEKATIFVNRPQYYLTGR